MEKVEVRRNPTHLVIEDKGSGFEPHPITQNERIYVSPCKPKLDGDKVMRLTAEAAEFHAGSVYLREDTPWIGDLVAELLGFPGVRHDDQVDRFHRRSRASSGSAVSSRDPRAQNQSEEADHLLTSLSETL